MTAIDERLGCMETKKNVSSVLTVVKTLFPRINIITMRKKYKQWTSQGKPTNFVCDDQRHFKTTQKALTEQGEVIVTDQILNMNRNQQQVTFEMVRKLAITQWEKENRIHCKEFSFNRWTDGLQTLLVAIIYRHK
jgi:hypothetical protein